MPIAKPLDSRSPRFEPALLRRNRSHLFGGASPLLLGVPLVAIAVMTGTWALLVPMIPFGLIAAFALAFTYANDNDPVRVAGKVAADDRRLTVGGKWVASTDDIALGAVGRASGRTVVHLVRKGFGRTLLIEVESDRAGHDLLQALGLEASQRVAEVRAPSGLVGLSFEKRLAHTLLPVVLGIVPALMVAEKVHAPFIFLASVLALVAYMLVVWLTPTRIRVGVDGVATHWLRTDAFVPFSEVADVRSFRRAYGNKVFLGVELVKRDGTKVVIPTAYEGDESSETFVFDRIREALTIHRQNAAQLDPALFARRGREAKAWVDSLRALGAGASADLRMAAVSIDDLLAVIADPSAAPGARVGAAIAAMSGEPEEASQRIRIAAQTTVVPRLRAALERVESAGADDEALVEALAEVEAGEPAPLESVAHQ